MVSADALAILAQAPYVFYGGENCRSVGTFHTTTSNGALSSDIHAILSCIETVWYLDKNCMNIQIIPTHMLC